MLEHQAEFANALRGGREMRERLFDAMERSYAHDFGNGRAGKGLYERLLSAVRAAGSPEATGEFETRFSPFLNPDEKHLNADDFGHLEAITDPEVTTTVQDRPRRKWGKVFALSLAGFLGAFSIGLSVVGMTATEHYYHRSYDTSRQGGGGIRIWNDGPADASRWAQGSGT